MDREEFLNQVKEVLTRHGFAESDGQYIRRGVLKKPDSTIIINGQIFRQGGPSAPIELIVILMGEAEVTPAEESQTFEVIDFQVRTNNKYVCGGCWGFYYEDLDIFTQLLKAAFKL